MDFSPLNWTEFFDKKQFLQIDDDKFNVYRKGFAGPLFYLLHGAGYTGLSWAVFTEQLSSKLKCQILAPDLRDHGDTETADNDDLSADCQVRDICNIYHQIFVADGKYPPTILVGHSMGGTLAVHAAPQLPNVLVVGVIDVVEGSAISSLSSMQQFLRNRPQQFQSIEKSIEWCVKSKTTSNRRAAQISMPSRLTRTSSSSTTYRWRTHLSRTEPHWQGWFKGLSKLFLQCEPVKVLILANVNRLDKELLTGQMRGQFQLEVLPKVGHAVHEDSPELVAEIFAKIAKRYKVIFDKYL